MNKTFPLIFSRTSKGQIQTWQIEVHEGKFRTTEGIQNGTLTTSAWTFCEGKNPGKANETKPDEQALKQAAAKHKKKLETGYHLDVDDIDTPQYFEPMLAHKWKEYKDEAKFPLYCQPKLDGMRCIVKVDGVFSRNGKPVPSAVHIRKILDPLFEINPGLVFDGELYNHALKHNFNKLISLAKKTKPTEADLKESEEKLQYWVYDFINPIGNGTFSHRFHDAIEHLKRIDTRNKTVRFVFTDHPSTEAELDDLYKKYLDEGFEGQMIRSDDVYENKRTKFLLKRKEFLEEEFELTDLEEGEGNRAGLATRAYFVDKRGKTFKAGVIGNNEYSADLLKNKKKVIGKNASVMFFEYTPDEKVPRFGKMKIIRDYE